MPNGVAQSTIANLIVGGLVLTFLGQHQTMDMLLFGNRDRQTVIPVLDNYECGPELALHLATPGTGPSRGGLDRRETEPARSVWASITFHPSSLATLKSITAKSLPTGSCYASTDDARSYVDVPAAYPGIVQNMTYTTYTLQEVVALSLGEIASRLQSANVLITGSMGLAVDSPSRNLIIQPPQQTSVVKGT
ncbi:uncharacterized protein TrAtP1_008859 [Trichoderma atroviride]|uniref:uncharacterized protein n=1 Tax=Hypocrea atroviridis TaxID=63577 RepID=UPI003332BEF2|nr:hypothetical protein TrAtP1_008859 [Trichoderma atroviride]